MTIKQCYELFNGDFDDVLERMMRESLVEKFTLKFLDDPSYDNLCEAISQQNREDAFRAAHTIKGVCQNLSFTKLYQSSNLLTQELRNGWGSDTENLFAQVQKDYAEMIDAIKQYKAQLQQ